MSIRNVLSSSGSFFFDLAHVNFDSLLNERDGQLKNLNFVRVFPSIVDLGFEGG